MGRRRSKHASRNSSCSAGSNGPLSRCCWSSGARIPRVNISSLTLWLYARAAETKVSKDSAYDALLALLAGLLNGTLNVRGAAQASSVLSNASSGIVGARVARRWLGRCYGLWVGGDASRTCLSLIKDFVLDVLSAVLVNSVAADIWGNMGWLAMTRGQTSVASCKVDSLATAERHFTHSADWYQRFRPSCLS